MAPLFFAFIRQVPDRMDFSKFLIQHQVFGGGKEMHCMVEDSLIVTTGGLFPLHPPVALGGTYVCQNPCLL